MKQREGCPFSTCCKHAGAGRAAVKPRDDASALSHRLDADLAVQRARQAYVKPLACITSMKWRGRPTPNMLGRMSNAMAPEIHSDSAEPSAPSALPAHAVAL